MLFCGKLAHMKRRVSNPVHDRMHFIWFHKALYFSSTSSQTFWERYFLVFLPYRVSFACFQHPRPVITGRTNCVSKWRYHGWHVSDRDHWLLFFVSFLLNRSHSPNQVWKTSIMPRSCIDIVKSSSKCTDEMILRVSKMWVEVVRILVVVNTRLLSDMDSTRILRVKLNKRRLTLR